MINHGLFGNRDVKPAEDTGMMASIMRAIKGSPEMKRALEDDERIAAQAERRPSIIAELKTVRDGAQKRIGALAELEASALAELEAIEPRYEATAAKWKRAKQALDFERHAAIAAETRLLDELEANADPIIDETYAKLVELWGDFQYDREKYALVNDYTIGVNPESPRRKSDKGRPIVSTNAPSLEKWRQALLAGLRDVPMLKRDPDQSNIAERCEAILASLPDWKQIVEIEL